MFIELVLTTQSYRNASELPLAASVGKKKFFDLGPVAIPKFKIARFGHVPGAKSWKIKKYLSQETGFIGDGLIMIWFDGRELCVPYSSIGVIYCSI